MLALDGVDYICSSHLLGDSFIFEAMESCIRSIEDCGGESIVIGGVYKISGFHLLHGIYIINDCFFIPFQCE